MCGCTARRVPRACGQFAMASAPPASARLNEAQEACGASQLQPVRSMRPTLRHVRDVHQAIKRDSKLPSKYADCTQISLINPRKKGLKGPGLWRAARPQGQRCTAWWRVYGAEGFSCEVPSGALVCLMKNCAAQMPTSYRMTMGMASASCETTSGGVTTAATTNEATMK